MKRGTSDHPKIDELSDALGIRRYQAVGILNTLWDWAQRYVPAGDIGKYSDNVIAKKIDWDGDASLLLRVLTEKRWIDANAQHRLIIHDWPEHCEDSVHTHLARHALLFANGSRPKLTKLPEKERKAIEIQYAALDCADLRTDAQDSAEKRSTLTLPIPSQSITEPLPLPLPDAIGDPVSPEAARKQQQPAAPSEVFLAATGTDAPRANGHSPGPTLVSRPRPMTDAEWGARDNAAIAHDLVNELATAHPVPGSLDKAFYAAAIEASKQPDPIAWAAQMRKTHAQHRIEWQHRRTKNPNAYIPQLAIWFSDGDCKHTGVAAANRNAGQHAPEPPPKYSPVPPEARNYGLKTK